MIKIGPAFGDYIRLEKSQKHRSNFSKNYSVRSYLLPVILIIAVVLITARLFYLQVISGNYYRNLSDANRTRTVKINAPRGIIFDRNGVPLVFNVPGFREVPVGTSLREVPDDIFLREAEENDKVKLISKDDALKLISEGKTNLEIDSLRAYPYKDMLSHVIGYIGQISEEELTYREFFSYKGGDLIGKIGIEREYEKMLKGINGKELVEVNSLGKVIRKLGKTDPISGKNITLTIDSKLQKIVFEAAGSVKKGAVIVSTPKGEILALLSKPSFDPNLFTQGENYSSSSENQYKNISQIILDSENQPLLNRAIGGVYPPGSTFKLVVAAAGLEEKKINKSFQVEDTGVLRVGDFSFANWYFTQYGGKEGNVNVVKAIQRSNDIFFYKLAELVGVDSLSDFAEKFKLGQKSGIDLIGEEKGLVPSPLWKEKIIGDKWFLGDTYHYGIGQGFLLTTPLQVNIFTQAIVNDGLIYKPHLLKTDPSLLSSSKFLDKDTISIIKEGMIRSCQSQGVAWPLFNFSVKNPKLKIDGKNFLEGKTASSSASKNDFREVTIACKTGTAQHGGEQTLPHAWITLFAPAENPQIVVTVLSESSGEGSSIAAPIAKKILEEWFSR